MARFPPDSGVHRKRGLFFDERFWSRVNAAPRGLSDGECEKTV